GRRRPRAAAVTVRPLRPAVGLLVVGSWMLSACSSTPEAPADDVRVTARAPPAPDDVAVTSIPPPPPPSPVPEPEAGVEVTGVPETVQRLVRGLYQGQDVAAVEHVRAALADAVPAPGPVQVTGVTGWWDRTAYAVLTAGEDLTLAVRAG